MGGRDPPEAEKRRPAGLGAVTVVFLAALPLLLSCSLSSAIELPPSPPTRWFGCRSWPRPRGGCGELHARPASRRPPLAGVRRAGVSQQVRSLQAVAAIALPGILLPRPQGEAVRSQPPPVRPAHGALPRRHGAAPVRPQRRSRRVQVRGVAPRQRPRQPDAQPRLHLPLRAPHRPRRPRPRDSRDGGPLLRAVPGDVVAAAAGLPPQGWLLVRLPGELRDHAREQRRPLRRRRRWLAAGVRVPPPGADESPASEPHLLRGGPPRARQVQLDGAPVRQLLRRAAVPHADVPGRAGQDVPGKGVGVPPPRQVPSPPGEPSVGDSGEVLRWVPRRRRRARRHTGAHRAAVSGAVRGNVRPDPPVHAGVRPPAAGDRRTGRRPASEQHGEGEQGRPGGFTEAGVLRQAARHVLHQRDGDRRGGDGVPAEPRQGPAHGGALAQRARPGRDLPAQLLRQGAHHELVDVRVRRARAGGAAAVADDPVE